MAQAYMLCRIIVGVVLEILVGVEVGSTVSHLLMLTPPHVVLSRHSLVDSEASVALPLIFQTD